MERIVDTIAKRSVSHVISKSCHVMLVRSKMQISIICLNLFPTSTPRTDYVLNHLRRSDGRLFHRFGTTIERESAVKSQNSSCVHLGRQLKLHRTYVDRAMCGVGRQYEAIWLTRYFESWTRTLPLYIRSSAGWEASVAIWTLEWCDRISSSWFQRGAVIGCSTYAFKMELEQANLVPTVVQATMLATSNRHWIAYPSKWH